MSNLWRGSPAYLFFFWLYLSFAVPCYGSDMVQLRNLLVELDTNYSMLLEETQILKQDFHYQNICMQGLQKNLDDQLVINKELKDSLDYQTQILEETKELLLEEIDIHEKEKIRAYIIGGVVGILVGGIIAGMAILVSGER